MAKYLLFNNNSDDTIVLPVSRLLAVDQTDGASVVLKFENKDGTAGSITQIDLTVTGGKEVEAMRDLMTAITSKVDVETIWDATSKTNSNFSDISIDSSGNNANGLTPGAGFLTGTGTVYNSWVKKAGNVIKTCIYIDLTGLHSNVSDANDIIGVDGEAGVAHIGQITAAKNGTIFAGNVRVLEAMSTGSADIDLYAATEGTGVEDGAISALTETQLLDGDTLAANEDLALALLPAADQYLYLVNGAAGGGAAVYDGGKLLIELYGTE
mgnify:FL=1